MHQKDGLYKKRKKKALEYDFSCMIWRDKISFLENMIFFL